jgi:hypothetical protein
VLGSSYKGMSKNPYLKSLLAEGYIVALVLLMHLFAQPNTLDTHFQTFIDPIIALSVFVLSAAVMGYLFLSEPLQLYLVGAKQEAITFFMKTVSSFALLTLIAVLILKLTQS